VSAPSQGRSPDFAAGADAFDHHVEEEQLREAEDEPRRSRTTCSLGELQRVVGNAARHAREPEECCGKKAMLKPMTDSQKCSLPRPSWYMLPVHLGSQKYTPAKIAKSAPETST